MFLNITCGKLVASEHPYRRLNKLLDLSALERQFSKLYSKLGTSGIPVGQGLRMLILQFMEDYSDRQMERALAENIAVKWFCGYELSDETPDHSYFHKLRKRLGTKSIAKVFDTVVTQMESANLVSNVFQFIDATAIITKTALWKERDQAISDGLKKLDNAKVKDYAKDNQARFGCRGKDKFFFGYKRHVNADMRHGVITKVAVTPGNVPDNRGLKHVLRWGGMDLTDKGYCDRGSANLMKARGCHNGAIKKRNMKGKNRDRDRWLSSVRMPYEGIFSRQPKRARYRGVAKVQYQAFMEAIAHNLKRWLRVVTLQKAMATG